MQIHLKILNMWRHENDTFLGISGIQWNIVGLY